MDFGYRHSGYHPPSGCSRVARESGDRTLQKDARPTYGDRTQPSDDAPGHGTLQRLLKGILRIPADGPSLTCHPAMSGFPHNDEIELPDEGVHRRLVNESGGREFLYQDGQRDAVPFTESGSVVWYGLQPHQR